MGVELKRINNESTRVKTNSLYIIDVLNNCSFAKHERTSKLFSYFIVNREISDIPSNIYDLPRYFREKAKELSE